MKFEWLKLAIQNDYSTENYKDIQRVFIVNWSVSLGAKLKKLVLVLTRLSSHPSYIGIIALLSGLDAFIFIIPNEAILIPAILAHPKRWISSTLTVTFGSALGAAAFSAVVSRYGILLVSSVFPSLLESKVWLQSAQLLKDHSILGLTIISFSPFPQHAAVAIAGLAHVSALAVFISVFIGRSCKYLIVSWCVIHSPAGWRKLEKRFKIR